MKPVSPSAPIGILLSCMLVLTLALVAMACSPSSDKSASSIRSQLKGLSNADRVPVILEQYKKFKAKPNLKTTVRTPACDQAGLRLTLTHVTDGSGLHEVIAELKNDYSGDVTKSVFYEDDTLLLRAGGSTEVGFNHYFYDDKQIACEYRKRAEYGNGADAPVPCDLVHNLPADTRGESRLWDTQVGLEEFDRRRHAGVFARPLRAFLGGHDYSTGLAEECTNENAVIAQIKADFTTVQETLAKPLPGKVSFSSSCKINIPSCTVINNAMEPGNTFLNSNPLSTQVEASFTNDGTGKVVRNTRILSAAARGSQGQAQDILSEIYYKNGLPFFVFIKFEQSFVKANKQEKKVASCRGSSKSRKYRVTLWYKLKQD